MFSRIHQKLGTAGFIIAIVALVAAMGGGAWAAAAKLNSTQKKEVKKIAQTEAKKFATAGPAGAPGAKGDPGAAGTAGAPGKDGTSVTTSAATVGECPEGGTKFTSASGTSKVCNGEEGEEGVAGVAGSPWTAGGVLPLNATETGTWAASFTGEGVAPISFTIPQKEALAGVKVVTVPVAGTNASCDDGTAPAPSVANPEADAGFLCVFVGALEGTGAAVNAVVNPATFETGAGKSGSLVLLGATGSGLGVGTWATTGF